MKFGSRIISVLSLFLLHSCSDDYSSAYSVNVIPSVDQKQNDTIIKDPETGKVFSRLNVANTYGLINRYHIPPNLAEKEIRIVYSGMARTNYAHSNASIDISINAYNGKTEGYISRQLRFFFEDINKWCYFRDSVSIKWESWQNRYEWISVFSKLGNSSKEMFDIQNLNVEIKIKQ